MLKKYFICFFVSMFFISVFAEELNDDSVNFVNNIETQNGSEIFSEDFSPSIKALIKENEDLKKLIYEKAYLDINGQKIETEGLIEGLAVFYTKYCDIRKAFQNNQGYCVVSGEELLEYRPVGDVNFQIVVAVDNINTDWNKIIKNQTLSYEESDTKDNLITRKTEQNKVSKKINKIEIFSLVLTILIFVFLIVITFKMSSIDNNNYKNINDCKNEIKVIKKIIEEQNEKLSQNLDKSIKYNFDNFINTLKSFVVKQNDFIKLSPEAFFKNEISCLPVRIINILKNHNIKTFEDLSKYNKKDISGFRDMGEKSMFELVDFLEKRGIYLDEN